MDQDAKWKADGTEAMTMRLVRAPEAVGALAEHEQQVLEAFHPEFCYPIFGDSQTIYGYKDLKIDLEFASGSLLTYFNVSYTAKLSATRADAQPDDVDGLLYAKLPADYLKNKQTFEKRVDEEATTFKPCGTRIGAYARKWVVPPANQGSHTTGDSSSTPKKKSLDKGKQKARVPDSDDEDEEDADDNTPHWEQCDPTDEGAVVVEAWHATMTTPGFRELHRRMQLFVLLFIEGGSYIDEEDGKWEFIVLYEKRESAVEPTKESYLFVGYTSLYPFFHYPDKIRMRISQFVILPPHQRCGHGAHLYNIVYFWLLMREEVDELVVEDPSEAFQDMRDKKDLESLLAQDAVLELPFDKAVVEETRKAMKLASRQFSRLLEMAVVLKVGAEEAKENKEFRLAVKERLYRHNYDLIKDLEPEERKAKLQTTFEGVVDDYVRILTGGEGLDDSDDDEIITPRRKTALKSIGEEDEEE